MKKILVLFVMVAFMVGIVSAVQTSTFLQHTTDASSALSTLHDVSADNSAMLKAWDQGAGNEGRVRITFPSDFTLNDITSISWEQYVESGYMAHVDVILDINDNGVYDSGTDDALVFEYAKVDPLNCELSGYATAEEGNQITTFGSTIGTEVNNDSYAWLTSGNAGPACTHNTSAGFYYFKLSEWKDGPSTSDANGKTISGTTRVLALEIEADSWISEPEVYIDDVKLNGDLIEDFEGTQGAGGQIVPDFTFFANPNPLDFGSLQPGDSNTEMATLSVGTSDLEVVGVAVSGDSLFTDNVLFSLDDITYVVAASVSPIPIAAESTEDLYVQLNVPVGTTSGSFAGVITYTIAED